MYNIKNVNERAVMKKILIIEDEKKIRRFLQLELEHEGYSVHTAEDGAEGFEKFEKEKFKIASIDEQLCEVGLLIGHLQKEFYKYNDKD